MFAAASAWLARNFIRVAAGSDKLRLDAALPEAAVAAADEHCLEKVTVAFVAAVMIFMGSKPRP